MLRSSFIYISTILFLFLIPLFSLPITGWDVESSKVTLLVLWGLVTLVGTAIHAYVNRSWRVPFKVSIVGLTAVLAFLLIMATAFFSDVKRISFFGDGYAIGVPLFILFALGIGYTVSHFARDIRRSGSMFLAIIGGMALVTLIALLTILIRSIANLPDTVTSYILGSVGKWTDMGIYAGLLLIVSLLSMWKFALKGIGASVAYALVVLSILMLAIVNIILLWILLCIVSVAILIRLAMNRRAGKPVQTKLMVIVSMIALISLLFTLDNQFGLLKGKIAGIATNVFQVSSVEAYPSVKSTFVVAKHALSDSVFFGFGPGRFSDAWKMYRPQEVNMSQFWATDFNYGVGLWPTFLVTSGVFGALGIIMLIAVILLAAIKLYRKHQASEIAVYISKTVSLATVFLTLMFFVYSPGLGAAIIYAAFVGIVVGLSHKNETSRALEIKFFARWNILGLSALIIVVAVFAGSLWVYGTKVYAAYTYNKAIAIPATDTQSFGQTIIQLNKAFMLDHRDVYARTLGQASFIQFNNILVNESSSYSQDDLRNLLLQVIQIAGNSVAANPHNSLNYIYMAELYRSIHANGVDEVYPAAQEFYAAAIARDPHNPLIRVLQARLAAQEGDKELAREKLEEAVSLKPNYTEAVFLLSQLLIDEGVADEAIAQLEARAKLAPIEPTVFFQLGFLKYAQKDYVGAIPALETAVALVPEYSNALYFLGLSYYYEDRDAEAIAAFERIIFLNPDSAEAKSVLNNMKQGTAPFASTSVAPEERDELPVEEGSVEEELP